MARDPEREDSVYDFLYIDTRRIAHFLSQFSQYGHLTALTRSVSETASVGGGLNVHVAKMDTATSEQTSQIRQFDAQWVAPLTFLDEANKRGMISRSFDKARIGRLSLVTGRLALFDLSIIQTAWGLGHIKSILLDAMSQTEPVPDNRHARRQQERTRTKSPSSAHEAAIEMLKTFPHAILSTIRVNEHSVWSSLKEDGLMVSASDLILKHGVDIAGSWNMVGVMDAFPDEEGAEDQNQGSAASSLGSLGLVIGGIAPAIRNMLGRPKEAFGMTPLLIFREVG